jgi:hypothetical protein
MKTASNVRAAPAAGVNRNSAADSVIPDFSVQWMFLPPFVAVVTIGAAGVFSISTSAVPVDAAIWGLTGLLFGVLSILYGIFIRRGFYKGLFPVQLLAQGFLLCPVSLSMGARMLQWVGVTMAVCGTVMLVFTYCRSVILSAPLPAEDASALKVDTLPIPFAVADKEGTVVFVSDTLLRMTKHSREAVMGRSVAQLIPLTDEPIKLEEKEWKLAHSLMPDGSYYLQLEEMQAPQPAPVPAEAGAGGIAPPGPLPGQAQAESRTAEEMYRVRRYKRWVSIALLRVNIRGDIPPEKSDELFNAYCRFVGENIRETDSACVVGPRDIYVLMPETKLDGARVALSKLNDFAPHMTEELQEFTGAFEILDKAIFLSASSGEVAFEEIMARLKNTLNEPENRVENRSRYRSL